jgi:hypothetical protein
MEDQQNVLESNEEGLVPTQPSDQDPGISLLTRRTAPLEVNAPVAAAWLRHSLAA